MLLSHLQLLIIVGKKPSINAPNRRNIERLANAFLIHIPRWRNCCYLKQFLFSSSAIVNSFCQGAHYAALLVLYLDNEALAYRARPFSQRSIGLSTLYIYWSAFTLPQSARSCNITAESFVLTADKGIFDGGLCYLRKKKVCPLLDDNQIMGGAIILNFRGRRSVSVLVRHHLLG